MKSMPEKCAKCKKQIAGSKVLSKGKAYHKDCAPKQKDVCEFC